MLSSLFGFAQYAPAMVCHPVTEAAGHREREEFCCKFGCASCTPSCIPRGTSSAAPKESSEGTGETAHYRVPLAVTHLLERWEWDDKARQAVRDEGRALVDVGTWDESTVIERDDLLSRARTKGEAPLWGIDVNLLGEVLGKVRRVSQA